MSVIKTMTIDGFYSKQEAESITNVVWDLPFIDCEFGKQINNFNMVPEEADQLFSNVLNKKVSVIEQNSGVFRLPQLFIHFEGFDSPAEWLFVVALQQSTFNIFEHQSGAKHALDGYKFNFQNLFEWNLTVNYLLEPGQGVFFRPWMFHSFDSGLIQTFRLKEQ